MMYYWRESSFNGLRELADQLQSEPDLEMYVSYLRLREQGLRKQSLRSLSQFISKAIAWDFERRRDFVDRVCLFHHQRQAFSDVIPHPLKQDLILPTLIEWAKREPTNPVPLRWQGDDIENLRRAVALDSKEMIAREMLAEQLLTSVDYSIHELPNGYGYIGDPAEDMRLLDEIATLADQLPRQIGRVIAEEAGELRAVVMEYLEYLSAGSGENFRDWMWSQNRPVLHRWYRV